MGKKQQPEILHLVKYLWQWKSTHGGTFLMMGKYRYIKIFFTRSRSNNWCWKIIYSYSDGCSRFGYAQISGTPYCIAVP